MVCKARLLAHESADQKSCDAWMIFSALLLVGFFGLLRPGELLALRAADATLPNSLAVGCSFAVIRLVRPKNARQMGRLQFTELRHPDAVNWLCWLKMRAPQEHAVRWPGTAAKFRHMFKTVCSAMKIRELRLSPASLRAGGATLLVDQGMEINRVRLLGRWAHLRSLEHYVQIARAEQIALSIPSVVARQLKSFLCRFSFLLVLPKFLAAQVALEHLVHAPVCKSKDPNMPSQSLEHGEEIERQFKKAVVAGGPLKGARFLDVGWEDLKKAARSYRSDPRFNQFAKRRLSEQAFGNQSAHSPAAEKNGKHFGCCKLISSIPRMLLQWLLGKLRGRIMLSLMLVVISEVVLSRPLFHVLVAKSLATSVRLIIRRSVSLVIMLVDTILDEAVTSFESSLVAPPYMMPDESTQGSNSSSHPFWQPGFLTTLLLHCLFAMIGALFGQRWNYMIRPPDRLPGAYRQSDADAQRASRPVRSLHLRGTQPP